MGELVVTRDDQRQATGKGYVYLVAIDEEKDAYCRGPFKPYDGHYFDPNEAVPVDKLFRKIDLNNLGKKIL